MPDPQGSEQYQSDMDPEDDRNPYEAFKSSREEEFKQVVGEPGIDPAPEATFKSCFGGRPLKYVEIFLNYGSIPIREDINSTRIGLAHLKNLQTFH